jgi:phosphoglycerol transferase
MVRTSGTQRAEFALELLTAAISLLMAAVVLQVWRSDLRVPFEYGLQLPGGTEQTPAGGGDTYFSMMVFKTVQETGWYFTNPRLGAPLGMDLRDHPIMEAGSVVVAKLLCFATGDWGLAINLFLLLGFPVCALSATFVLRQLRVSAPMACAMGVLYSLLPYHFMRGQGHIFLGFYAVVPLAILACAWVLESAPLFAAAERKALSRQGKLGFVFMVLIGVSGVYYAAYSLLLLAVAAVMLVLWRRPWRALAMPAFFAATMVVTLLLMAAPFLLHRAQRGTNHILAARSPAEVEVFGLKPVQLVLPVPGHRIPQLAAVTQRYDQTAPLVTENRMSGVGVVGSAGLLVLLAALFMCGRSSHGNAAIDEPALFDTSSASRLFLALTAFAVIGGGSSLVAYLVSPVLRSHCRVSIFIALLAFFAMGRVLDAAMLRIACQRTRKVVAITAAILLVVVGAFDQTTAAFVPAHERARATYGIDRAFVQKAESALPVGASVLQLPYLPFPEAPTSMSYEHFRPYLHSRSLRWSFGAIRNRPEDMVVRGIISSKSLEEFRAATANAGFAAVCVDLAFPDAANYAKWLHEKIDPNPLTSDDGRLVLFRLPPASRSGS